MADEISREALLIYLENIRTMETIIVQSEEKLPQIEEKKQAEANKMRELENKKYSWVCNKPSEPKFKLEFDDDNQMFLFGSLLCIPVGIILLLNDSWVFLAWVALIMGIICLIFFIGFLVSTREQYKLACQRYPDELRAYEERKRKNEEEKRIYEEERNIQLKKIHTIYKEGDLQKAEIQSDIESTKQLLQQAYSTNIIPLQFRNIQGVYYLYDYLSTSTQTLSDALMQCNLDAIKQKLDEVINLQGAAIIQQAQANAAIYEQNQRILEAAEATMNNTAIAAKYAQISAVNSQLSLKMQSKQLAYQRADFWLK